VTRVKSLSAEGPTLEYDEITDLDVERMKFPHLCACLQHEASAFPCDVFRALVLPQAEESRVAQFVSRRPLGEADLGDELWFHPMDGVSRHPLADKWTSPVARAFRPRRRNGS
jgi:hypothetical protein